MKKIESGKLNINAVNSVATQVIKKVILVKCRSLIKNKVFWRKKKILFL